MHRHEYRYFDLYLRVCYLIFAFFIVKGLANLAGLFYSNLKLFESLFSDITFVRKKYVCTGYFMLREYNWTL